MNTEHLTDTEKQLLGLMLFSTAMKMGPGSFIRINCIVDKLNVRPEFEFFMTDWISHATHNLNKDANESDTMP